LKILITDNLGIKVMHVPEKKTKSDQPYIKPWPCTTKVNRSLACLQWM